MRSIRLRDKRTRILCTLGPASNTAAEIERLIRAGMDIARLNLSHGTLREHARIVRSVRKRSERLGVPIGVLIDLSGPKYRAGRLRGGQVVLKRNNQLVLTARDVEGDSTTVPVNLSSLSQHVKRGSTILLDDGVIHLKVLDTGNGDVRCRVVVGGTLFEGRGLVVPGMQSRGPFVTESIKQQIAFAAEQRPDFLAVSFVSKAPDIQEVKQALLGINNGNDMPIIAKVERGEAVRNFDSILAVSDGIMVARGDLGTDIPLERVPLVQREIIQKCNRAGKPVITATEMLESMVSSARPTRAEASDVANAVFDGSDAIMLSAETAIGRYPVRATRIMARIAREAERRLPYDRMLAERADWLEHKTEELISYDACHTAHYLKAAAIIAFTQSGSTAARVSKYRPKVPVLAIAPDEAVCRRMLLNWGVSPVPVAELAHLDDLFTTGVALSKELGVARPGDLVVITGGVPMGVTGSTNLLKVEQVY